MLEYELKRYNVRAKRKNTSEPWSNWTDVDTIEEAEMHAKHVEELGFLSKIVDREDKSNAGQID